MTAGRAHLLTYYPAASDRAEFLAARLGRTVEPVTLSSLASGGGRALVRRLRGLGAELLLVDTHEQAPQLVSTLMVLALLAKARKRAMVDADGTLRPIRPAHLLGLARDFAWDFVQAVGSLGLSWWRCRRLATRQRMPCTGDADGRALYLRTNLAVGIKAGGMIAHTLGVVSGLARNGIATDFASCADIGGIDAIPGLRRVPLRLPRTMLAPRELNHFLYDSRVGASLAGLGRRPPYRLIYHRLTPGSLSAVTLSRRWGLPLVLEYNGSEVWIGRNWGTPFRFSALYEAAEDACLRHAHVIVAVSEVLRQELIQRGVEPKRIACHPNGVDAAVFDPGRFAPAELVQLRADLGIGRDDLVVGFIGTFGQWHGAEVLAEAFRRLCADDPAWVASRRLHLLFIGDGVGRARIEDILADPACSGRFTLAGLVPQHDAPRHLACCDVFASPHVLNPDGTRFFGSPTKLFEYMAMARPVIASDIEQVGEVLAGSPRAGNLATLEGRACGEREAGLLVQPGDAAELAHAIRLAGESPSWRLEAGRRARERAEREYGWDKHVSAILAALTASEGGHRP